MVAPKRYLNRELTWLRFDERVLEEAQDHNNPLIERLRFLTIFHTNLDEFFMIRVSGLRQQVSTGLDVLSLDGLSPRAQLTRIRAAVIPLLAQVQRCLCSEILPGLETLGVKVVHYNELDQAARAQADAIYRDRIHPVLTPLAVSSTKTFPFISNLSLNIAVMVRSPNGERRLARVKVPHLLPRLLRIDGGDPRQLEPPIELLPIEELIIANLQSLFVGMEIGDPSVFRVTRDADIEIKEDEAEDLLTAIREEVRQRRFGRAVRLEVQRSMPESTRELLRVGLSLTQGDVYQVDDPLDLPGMKQLLTVDLPTERFAPMQPRPVDIADIFTEIRQGDILLHHPYQAFSPVVDFLQAAARDPKVRAIKQTLYRTSGDSAIVRALADAATNGKQVAAVVELKARFDEENNITWAQMLEENGVHVIYGEVGRKVHAKLSMVVRSEEGAMRRYAHIGTGNYNATTARIYTDLGLFTCDPRITSDVADLFNRLTGFSRPSSYHQLLVAWRFMRKRLIERIDREIVHARAGRPAHLIFKCNSIAERQIIDALYEASAAGVRVDLLVRGTCCLRPGVPGLSENITVRSVLGRFLEHSRIYWFGNGGDSEVFIGSADLMSRNLKNRIEVLTPVLNTTHRRWIRQTLLERYLRDTERTRLMRPDGTYERLQCGGFDVQQAFLADR